MEREIIATFNNSVQRFSTRGNDTFNYTSTAGPYEYLLGALAGCFFRTLEDAEEVIEAEEIVIKVGGNKRKTSPTTLEETKLTIEAKGITDKAQFEKAIAWTAENCSIYNTLSKVSKMEIEIHYI